ncbi:MAG: nuclear transport factor 2 family protein [Gammaproteobacteria bacterium]|nr:nuclear transport factor 2 family protein [Gammaproteobacteria bacterium]NNJ96674.1 nuclear transport factor 2 family protein [Gammaproteobacteria bacterium]
MKKLICIFALLTSTVTLAATNTGTEADHEQLRQLLISVQEAVNKDQIDMLEAHLHEDYVITVMNQEVVTKDWTLEQLFNEWFKKSDAFIKSLKIAPVASIETNIYDGRFGVCYGISTDSYELADGRSFEFNSKWTATMLKEGDQWKLLALHVGVDPIENTLIDGYRTALGFGGVLIEISRLFK